MTLDLGGSPISPLMHPLKEKKEKVGIDGFNLRAWIGYGVHLRAPF